MDWNNYQELIDQYIETLDPEDIESHTHAEKFRQFILGLPK
jgi:hypothetical protein